MQAFVEWTGVLLGLISILLLIVRNRWGWVFGNGKALLYLLLFLTHGLFSNVALQVFFIIMGIWGYLHWKQSEVKNRPARIGFAPFTLGLCACLYLSFGLWMMSNWLVTFVTISYLDLFDTAVFAYASWLQIKGVGENWLGFLAGNFVMIPICWQAGMVVSIFLYAVYAGLALTGYRRWQH